MIGSEYIATLDIWHLLHMFVNTKDILQCSTGNENINVQVILMIIINI